ncbi:hypothetical protein R3P38DRAFT_1437905 [Favolaschia claudopus]|uniref:Uncharacterized protein n=1 Tax=Favolaschia claudopus TaxID=2862362 RepID=A0AAW0APD1_9AGAR
MSSVPATPTHQRLASYMPFSSSTGPYQQPAHAQAAAELDRKFVFLSPTEFLKHYFPLLDPAIGSPSLVDYDELTRISQMKNELEMYDPLIEYT